MSASKIHDQQCAIGQSEPDAGEVLQLAWSLLTVQKEEASESCTLITLNPPARCTLPLGPGPSGPAALPSWRRWGAFFSCRWPGRSRKHLAAGVKRGRDGNTRSRQLLVRCASKGFCQKHSRCIDERQVWLPSSREARLNTPGCRARCSAACTATPHLALVLAAIHEVLRSGLHLPERCIVRLRMQRQQAQALASAVVCRPGAALLGISR